MLKKIVSMLVLALAFNSSYAQGYYTGEELYNLLMSRD